VEYAMAYGASQKTTETQRPANASLVSDLGRCARIKKPRPNAKMAPKIGGKE
jgi:hypothetical protein